MSAVLRWRCDICRGEAEVVEEVRHGLAVFYSPTLPTGWVRKTYEKQSLDLCSQRCIVEHAERVLAREQRKLVVDGT